MNELQTLYAWVADGEDSVCAVRHEGVWIALVAGRKKNAEAMRYLAEVAARGSGKPVRLVRYQLLNIEDEVLP